MCDTIAWSLIGCRPRLALAGELRFIATGPGAGVADARTPDAAKLGNATGSRPRSHAGSCMVMNSPGTPKVAPASCSKASLRIRVCRAPATCAEPRPHHFQSRDRLRGTDRPHAAEPWSVLYSRAGRQIASCCCCPHRFRAPTPGTSPAALPAERSRDLAAQFC